jgi:ATP-dependent metalloprotease
MSHMEWAKDRISMGAESKRKISDDTKLNTAYHEGGHALVALYTPGASPLHKVTCLPRGGSLGHVCSSWH